MKRPAKLFICSLITFVSTGVIGFIAFSSIIRFVVYDQKALKGRNEVREFYIKVPFPLNFRVFFFNVTNPLEVHNGATPILKEVGPYCYDAYKEKIDIHESTAEDSLSYTPYEIYVYNKNKTAPLNQDDYVTVLHPLIVGIVNVVHGNSPALLNILNNAISPLFGNPKSIFLTAKVRDILFDGLVINCSSKEFAAKAVCTQLKTQLPNLKEPQKNVFLFSLLGSKNGTLPTKIKVSRGIKEHNSLGRVLEVNDEKMLNIWATKQCNTFNGTDGWIFPPYFKKEEGVKVFSTDLCRNLLIYFVEEINYGSVEGWLYHANLGDMSSVPEDKCYCPTPKTCLKKGVMDLTKCIGVPVYASLPHFLDADPDYLNEVKGLNPINDEHINKIIFEPMTGTPLSAYKRLQINFPIQPINKITLMKNVPVSLHPILWIEEGVNLEGEYLKKVTDVFLLLKIAAIFKWIVLILSIGGMAASGYMHFTKRNENVVAITPVQNLSSSSNKASKSVSRKTSIADSINNNDMDNGYIGYNSQKY